MTLANTAHLNYKLRAEDPLELVENHAAYTRQEFSYAEDDALPVVICAKDEENDLPATLISLARSERELIPVVIDNGSQDRTAEFATEMGALVLPAETPGKMAAIKSGLTLVSEEGYERILLTDADTIVGPQWAESMEKRLLAQPSLAVVTGLIIHTLGESHTVDIVRSLRGITRQVLNSVLKKPSSTVGNNMALQTGEGDVLISSLERLPDKLFPGEDRAIRDVTLGLGGTAVTNFSADAVAFTINDRIRNWREYRAFLRGDLSYADLYRGQYGHDMMPYTNN